ncbi:DNA cytosine methyltransferase [Parafrankia sp. CH37]|uniref:DNA cytosine methyltransferase n=1 Tax=Parafrankia sp. CH37 TaxID=683308 RepID=UPI0037CA1441
MGVEWDRMACETRRAAGLPTIESDVEKLRPEDFSGITGLIASPPCQPFSAAGKECGSPIRAAGLSTSPCASPGHCGRPG